MDDPILSARGLVVRRRGKEILHGIDLTLQRGETLGIVGESGSGKTTLAQTLIGLLPPASGEISLFGKPFIGSKRQHARMQYVFQDPYGSLDPLQTIKQILLEPLTIHGIRGEEATKRIHRTLNEVGLDDWVLPLHPGRLSGGQRQRIAICRALLLEPEILILDEPVASLDVSIQAQIINLLLSLMKGRELSIIFIAHDLHLVRLISRRTLVLYQGWTVEEGLVDDLFTTPRHPYTALLIDSILSGDPSDPLPSPIPPNPEAGAPSGCPFTSRCPLADNACRSAVPPLEEISPGHACRCLHPLKQNQ